MTSKGVLRVPVRVDYRGGRELLNIDIGMGFVMDGGEY